MKNCSLDFSDVLQNINYQKKKKSKRTISFDKLYIEIQTIDRFTPIVKNLFS